MKRKSRLLALGLWLSALLACAAVIVHSRFSADMSAFLPQNPDARQRVLVDALRDGVASRLLLVGIDGGDAAQRADASRAVADALRAGGLFGAVENGAGSGMQADRALLLSARYALTDAPDDAYTAAGLHREIANGIANLASPLGDTLKRLLPRDPTGAMLRLGQALLPSGGPRLDRGVWVSTNGRRALLLLETRAQGTDTDAQQRAIQAVRAAFAQARTVAPGLRLVLSGPGLFAVQSRALIQRGVERVSLLGGVLVLGLLLVVYRSPLMIALGLLPVLSGVAAAVAAVSLGFGVVHGVTLGFGTTLIGEAIDYAIYLFVQRDAGGQRQTQDFWPTIRLGMLTSVVGFSTLLPSDFPGLAQLGLYSIAGLLAAALVTRFVLPHLIPRGFVLRDLSPLGARLAGWLPRLRAARAVILGVLLLPSALALALLGPRMWDTRLAALSPIGPAAMALDAQLRAQLGTPDSPVLVAVSAPGQEQALEAAERIAPRLRALRADGVIAGFDSPADALPSARTQTRRLQALPDAQTLRARLAQAVQGLPVRAAVFEPFVQDVQAARARGPLTREDFRHGALSLALDGMLLRDAAGRWTALLPVRGVHGVVDTARVDAALAGTGAITVDLGRVSSGLYANYLHTAIWASLGGLGAIALLLAAALRSPRRAWRVLAPLLAAVLVVSAGLLLSGQRLTLLHLVGLMLVVAIGSNYALFFDQGSRQDGGIAPRTLASLLLANLSTVCGFGPLVISGVPLLQSLGLTVAPGVLLALVFAAMLSAPPHAARA